MAAALVACSDAGNREPLPDPILRDSLGLSSGDELSEVALRHDQGRETVTPDTMRVAPGQWGSFRSADHWPRQVRFILDSLNQTRRDYLEGAGIVEGPPLVRAGSRWVIELTGAPPGRYPFEVLGPRRPGRGVVLVEDPAPR